MDQLGERGQRDADAESPVPGVFCTGTLIGWEPQVCKPLEEGT